MGNNKIIGAKIKNIRESKQLSIEEVAERSGLGIEQIERIEGNLDFPSLAPLIKIARVLGVRLGTFLDDQAELGPVVCRKKDSEADGIGFTNNATQGHKHMDYHSLSQDKSGRHMEPFLIEIAPSEEGEISSCPRMRERVYLRIEWRRRDQLRKEHLYPRGRR